MVQHQESMAVKVGKDVLKGKEVNPRQPLDGQDGNVLERFTTINYI